MSAHDLIALIVGLYLAFLLLFTIFAFAYVVLNPHLFIRERD